MSRKGYELFKLTVPATVIAVGQVIKQRLDYKKELELQKNDNDTRKYESDSQERIARLKIESEERIAKYKIDSGSGGDSTTLKSINEDSYFDRLIEYIENITDPLNEVQLYGLMFLILTGLVLIFIFLIFIDSYVNNLLDKYEAKKETSLLNRIKNLFINFNKYIFKSYNLYNIIIILLTLTYMLYVSFLMFYFG